VERPSALRQVALLLLETIQLVDRRRIGCAGGADEVDPCLQASSLLRQRELELLELPQDVGVRASGHVLNIGTTGTFLRGRRVTCATLAQTLLIEPIGADNGAMDQVDDTETVEEVDEEVGPTPEQQQIMSWRLSQISALGIDQLDAQLLAETGADLGLLRRLVGQGCPPPLAVRIAL
jgi:hypothetical protein